MKSKNWKTNGLGMLILGLALQLAAIRPAFGQSLASTLNPLQLAMGRWYQALDGVEFSMRDVVPTSVAFDGEYIWVAGKRTQYYSTAYIYKVRRSDGGVVLSVSNTDEVVGMAFDGANIWTAHNSGTSSYLMKRAASTGKPLGVNIALFETPADVLFDGANVWVTIPRRSQIVKVRARDQVILGSYRVGVFPSRMAYDGASIWVLDSSYREVNQLRATDGVVINKYGLSGKAFEGIAFDGECLWITDAGSDIVQVWNFANHYYAMLSTAVATVDPRAVPSSSNHRPTRIAFDGVYMWITNNLSNTVAKIRAADGAWIGLYPVGTSPVGIAFDGVNMWIANSGSGSISKR